MLVTVSYTHLDVYKRQVIALDSVYNIRLFVFGCQVFKAQEKESDGVLV